MLRPVLSVAEMVRAERAAMDAGVSSIALMETAARAFAEVVRTRFDPKKHHGFVILAGPGNNGGDAVAVARWLRDRFAASSRRLYLVTGGRPRSAELEQQLARFGGAPEAQLGEVLAALDAPVMVIDGLFGSGLSRGLEGPHAVIAERLSTRRADRLVIAVDIPSGVDGTTGLVHGPAVRADLTVTFQAPKLGHYLYPGRALRGELVTVDIGVPLREASATLVGDDVIAAAFPPREADSHKGRYGNLMVVAGHPDRPGAALLTGRAALRAGAGLVTIATSSRTLDRVAPQLVELMGLDAGSPRISGERVLAGLERKTALVIGPSLDAEDHAAVRAILRGTALPAVVDAGALDAFERRAAPTVLTPHTGEMARLCRTTAEAISRDRPGAARGLARELGATVVLKGASTLVAEPSGELAIVASGNPGMAKAGSGDALAGIIGALLARGLAPGLAARAGAHLHGLAGDRARDRHGEVAMLASDLLAEIGPTIEAARPR